ncbi:MAG: hypothetical protein WBW61_13565 [Rhodanobacteraceae bacterium]
MTLRRIASHFKKQHWTGVFIELLIVVLGVFIGLQAQDWNAARNARADARAYRQGLITDMELSVSRNQTQIDYGRLQIKQLDLVLSALTSCDLPADKQAEFNAGLYNMGKFDLPIMVMGTIDELNATGNFKLVGTPALRRAISNTVRIYRTTVAVEPQLTGRVMPNVNYVRFHVRFVLNRHLTYPLSIDSDKVFYDFGKLCSDGEFINAVAAVREMTLASDALNQRVLDRQAELLTTLNKMP